MIIASDHAGLELKKFLSAKASFTDLGVFSAASVNYVDVVKRFAAVFNGQGKGVLICGSGIGVSMAANRYAHIRAALCRTVEDARISRQHNDANVLVLGARVTTHEEAYAIWDAFNNTDFDEGRHIDRVKSLGSVLTQTDSDVATLVATEYFRQQWGIELIASENITSAAVREAQGSVLTNKYAEGYPGRRYYGGCQHVDEVERLAIKRVTQLFSCAYANVQPHSGSQANQAVFSALLTPGDTILGMRLDAGGHLTHGSPVNLSGKWFQAYGYGLDSKGYIDYDEVRRLACENKPRLIIAGGSAYSRIVDFKRMRAIADEVGAYLMVDMAHFAGLVAGKVYPSPVPYAHVVTSTTHKTLRGPRGGIILSDEETISKKIDSALFPGIQGGPLMHVIAAKAVAFKEALTPEFSQYAQRVIANAKVLVKALRRSGFSIVSGGTDTHLCLVDVRSRRMTGREAEERLGTFNITCNKNSVVDDPRPPRETSGIRLGTPLITTRGFGEEECVIVADLISSILSDDCQEYAIREAVRSLCTRFPYP